MTKFEELQEIISGKKNKDRNSPDVNNKEELEVAGSESTRAPLVATADEELDPDIIDMLYTKPRNVPNRGEGSSAWDSDY